MELSSVYKPKETEEKIYNLWLKAGFFNPDKLPKRHKKPYTIFLPPPNITGELHMGHALNASIQDVLIRWKRMKGFKALWVPGIDHAGIATQVRVEKELKKEGKSRFELGKEKFIERVWQWKKKYGNLILEQFKKLGCSFDLSRKKFTLDKNYSEGVKKAFFHYYKKGLIYQGKRPVFWCSRCQTSLSDLEIEYKREKSHLWYLKYLLKNSKKYIVVATTRPETMFGDVAVAVNPKDKRYKNLIGKKAILPISQREIPIIFDSMVDPNFGSGAVKITPAHDLNDYEIALKHKLSLVQVIDKDDKITKEAPFSYQNLSKEEARKKIIEELKKEDLFLKAEPYEHDIPFCYRCHSKIEILPSKQWFLKMTNLASKAQKVVKMGKIKFVPKKWEKIYFQWLKNIKDWCISRQIWWGHKIPLKGEEDVLDTWFSSALWPLCALGWPKKNKDFKKFYPSDVLSTDRGIINLWVARMIFSALEFTKKIPFRIVYIHPTVLTKEGKRMSKSLGTGVDPLLLIEKYGADATRFGVLWQLTGIQDIRFVEDNIILGKKFCNKIWNASRFVLIQLENLKFEFQNQNLKLKMKKLGLADKKILKALETTIKFVDKSLENFYFGHALKKLYNFFWHDFCDYYIEEFKKEKSEQKNPELLLYVLLNSLKILHPFIPFITEEIYQKILGPKKTLIIEEWPR